MRLIGDSLLLECSAISTTTLKIMDTDRSQSLETKNLIKQSRTTNCYYKYIIHQNI